MALRATAPVFIPSFVNAESTCLPPTEKTNHRKSRRRRQRSCKPTTRDLQHHSVTNSSKRNKSRRQKNNSHHRKTRRNRNVQEDATSVKEERENELVAFPPLVPQKSNDEFIPNSSRDWLVVAEKAHEQEEEERRREVVRLSQEANERVKLTPLFRSTKVSNDSSVDSDLDHSNESDEEANKAHKPQHYIHVDMIKLRNRWWELIREKNRDSEERRRELMEESTLPSDSTESYEEEPVETAPFYENAEHSLGESTILEVCLESSYPLHRAVMDEDEKAIRLLLEHDDACWIESFVEPSKLGIVTSVSQEVSTDSFSPLFLAVYLDKPQLVKVLFNGSPVAAHIDSHGHTALMLAAEMGLEGCIRALLACGASLLDKDNDGDTAVHYACRAGVASSAFRAFLFSDNNRTSLLRVLSCKNANGQTPLHMACAYCHVHLVEVFLTACNSSLLAKLFRIRNDQKQTPLLAAVRAESTDIVMSLLMWRSNDQGGRDKGYDGLDGDCCPLFYAASTGSTDMVLLLLEFMDPLAQKTGYNLDAALQATVQSTADTRLDNMRVLVNAGANPCSSFTNKVVGFPDTALSICCTKGDSAGIAVMLDSWNTHLAIKHLSRRQDPVLRRQPESYFAAMEAKEKAELKLAMTNALVQSLFAVCSGSESASPYIDVAMALFHRGAQLSSSDYALLKASIHSGRLVSPADASTDEGSWFAACYRLPILEGTKRSEALDLYDRVPLQFWSQALCSFPWMQECSRDTSCGWIMVQRNKRDKGAKRYECSTEESVVLIAEGERLVVNASLISQKSAKLAAAVRFGMMNEESDGNPLEIQLGISSHLCRWLLQHMYHGSIMGGWPSDPLQCAHDLMELAMVAQEFLCPTLLRECEMRLLSADPFQCYCCSCCQDVRAAQSNEDLYYGECMYRVQGPSKLLSFECVLDALAVSGELQSFGAFIDMPIVALPMTQGIGCNERIFQQVWDSLKRDRPESLAPFAHVKDASLQICLRDFVKVTQSPTFLSHMDLNGDTRDRSLSEGLAGTALLQTCLDELSSLARLQGTQHRERLIHRQSHPTVQNEPK